MSTPQPQTDTTEPSELLRWWLESRRWVDRHANKILLTVIVGTVVLVASVVMARSTRAKNEAAWRAFGVSKVADDYRKVAEDHPGTSAEHPARMVAAREYLSQGMQQVTANRKASDENLENAKTQLSKLLDDKSTPKDIREEALLKMAVCLESLSDGDLKSATEAYERLLKEFPTTLNKSWVEEKLKILAKPETAAFYRWFRTTNPSPEDRPKPQDIKPSEAPNIQLDGEGIAPPSSGDAAREMPAEGAVPPVTPSEIPSEKPATETPAAEKPAEAATTPEKTPEAPAVSEKPAEAAVPEAPKP
ncbi:MAG: hypothetical protein DWH91_10825 [Planctomycetota bacterium]|nr:MAG: hypothetical protein DWH91_10825 [Planctomycetota bacterium]